MIEEELIRDLVGLRFGLKITRLMSSIVASGGQRPGHGPIGRRRGAKAGAGPKRLSSSPSLLVRDQLFVRVCIPPGSWPITIYPVVGSQFRVHLSQLSRQRLELVALQVAELLFKSAHFVLQSSEGLSARRGFALTRVSCLCLKTFSYFC